MNGPEIKARIEAINEENKKLLVPDIWTINSAIQANLKKIAELQESCDHEDDGTGTCKWCFAKL